MTLDPAKSANLRNKNSLVGNHREGPVERVLDLGAQSIVRVPRQASRVKVWAQLARSEVVVKRESVSVSPEGFGVTWLIGVL